MKDELFIDSTIKKGRSAKEKVISEFSALNSSQLNWKPSEKSWSIAECLDHLIVSDSTYFTVLKRITGGTYEMSFKERYSPFSKMWGAYMKKQLDETVRRKMTAPGKIKPSASKLDPGLLDRYHTNLDTFLHYISKCRDTDLDKTILTSPMLSIVTYSLRDCLQFLVTHEHRHINQAIRVKSQAGFPGNA